MCYIKDIIKSSIIYDIVDYNDEEQYKTILRNYVECGLISTYVISSKIDFDTSNFKVNSIKFKTNEDIEHTIIVDKRGFKLKKIIDNI